MKPFSIIALILIAVFAASNWIATNRSGDLFQSSKDKEIHHVTYVFDGDTIKLDNGEHVRLIGIDAPEAHDNDKLTRDVAHRHVDRHVQLAMGQKAARYARGLLSGQDVRLVYDVEPRDRYHRLLAYVYLMDGTFVNEQIIREGYAYPLTIPPNVHYAHKFKQCFDEAREQKKGLWGDLD